MFEGIQCTPGGSHCSGRATAMAGSTATAVKVESLYLIHFDAVTIGVLLFVVIVSTDVFHATI